MVFLAGILYLQFGNSRLIEQRRLGFGRCGGSWKRVSGSG